MKLFTTLFTLFCFAFTPLAKAQDGIDPDDVMYTDEDDELFNRGKFVGVENDDWMRARKRERNKNWTIALTTTALGIATVILVGQNHNK